MEPTSDVLAGAAEAAGLSAEELGSVRRWLALRFEADRYAQLDQAGHDGERIALADVFHDACVEEGEPFLATFLQEPDPLQVVTPQQDDRPVRATVLVGGPGQGKSTLGQFACQIVRARLLRGEPGDVGRRAAALCGHPIASLAPDHLPLAIDLPRFAAWASAVVPGGPTGMLDFLASSQSGQVAGLSAAVLGRLARRMGFLLVADAFDEVGGPGDRARVVTGLRDLLESLEPAPGRTLATTRPQGYADEFAAVGRVQTRWLTPLDRDEALAYGSALLRAAVPDVERRADCEQRLREAAADASAARLLTTPLQVSIVAALVQRGRAPRERWRLFQQYYQLLYQREITRQGYASTLLRDRQAQVEEVHRRVALVLQAESETDGGSRGRLDATRLEEVIRTVLAEEGVAPEEQGELARDLRKAAEQRLVLLVEPEPGQFGFEIRSLQEFFAAWALVKGERVHVEARLARIAPADGWRHVLLFAASHAFAEGTELRSFVVQELPRTVDADPLAAASGAGAVLALRIAEDGGAAASPRFEEPLFRVAVGVLDSGPFEAQLELLGAPWSRAAVTTLRDELDRRCASGDPEAWALLMAAQGAVPWARDVLERSWTHHPEEGVLFGRTNSIPEWVAERMEGEARQFSPRRFWARTIEGGGWAAWLTRPHNSWYGHGFLLGRLRLPTRPEPPRPPPAAWLPWVEMRRFEEDPTLATLLAAASDLDEERFDAGQLSWPALALLRSPDRDAALRSLESGELGAPDDWVACEQGWRRRAEPHVAGSKLWLPDALSAGPPLRGVYLFGAIGEALGSFEAASEPVERRMLARATAWRTPLDPSTAASILAVAPDAAGVLVIRLAWPLEGPLAEALSMLDSRYLRFGMEVHDLMMRFMAAPEPLALEGVITSLQSWPAGTTSWSAEELRAVVAAHESRRRGHPGWTVLRVLCGALHEPPDPVTLDPEVAQALVTAIEAGRAVPTEAGAISPADLCQHLLLGARGRPWADPVRRLGRRLAGERPSGLTDLATWRDLALPEPPPRTPASQVSEPLPDAPVVLRKLDLRHVGPLRQLMVEPAPPADAAGQWIVLVGPNGSGKTTILRSLALALRNVADPSIWPDGAFELRPTEGSPAASIAVETVAGAVSTSLRSNGSFSVMQAPRMDRPRPFPLFAYGCRRGSALGGSARRVDDSMDDGAEVATLFHEGADLVHAPTWLLLLDGESRRDPSVQPIYDGVVEALKSLLDLEDVTCVGNEVRVRERGGPSLAMSRLSDGYLTTAGWFLDLLARWVAMCRRLRVPLAADFASTMRGLVLVDEIDLHLHPRWQLEVIGRTRRLLPQMSFVVTTHNPVALVGARPDEVWILDRVTSEVTIRQGSTPAVILTGGQILHEYFGLRDLYPHELGEKVQRFGFLSAWTARNDEEEDEVRRLDTELRAALVHPGFPIRPRDPLQ